MDQNTKNSPELDGLQKEIENSAEAAAKFHDATKVDSVTDSSSDVEKNDQNESEKVESESPLEPVSNSPNESREIQPHSVDQEVDDMLSVEPEVAQAAAAEAAEAATKASKKSFAVRTGRFLTGWWRNKKLRYAALLGLPLLVAILALVPSTRYAALNLAGVRVSSSLAVVDSQTGLPLENIPVSLADQELRTGEDGVVTFYDVKQGDNILVVDKLGYAEYEKDLVLGWGSNPLGEQSLVATGARFSFVLADWQSQQRVNEAEAKSGEDVAKANESGEIIITVGDLSEGSSVVVSADGYRDEAFQISDLSRDEISLSMVPAKKHVFVSNRDGEYDLYKIDVDGMNEEVLLAASGEEREAPYVLPHQERNVAAYISSRDGERNDGNYILDGLFLVDVESGDLQRITRSEQLHIVGWSGDKLVYVAVVEGVSAGNSQRSKIFSYDLDSGQRTELASSNYFNDVDLIDEKVYYSVSGYSVPSSAAKLFSINPDGTDKITIVDTQVWTIVRQDFKNLLFNAIDKKWFGQEIGQQVNEVDPPSSNPVSRDYSVSPDGKKAVWVDTRDGKGVLIVYDIDSGVDEVIQVKPGLSAPAYWINDDTIIYRISTDQETADHVLNTNGGEPVKIVDVTGNRSRYFY